MLAYVQQFERTGYYVYIDTSAPLELIFLDPDRMKHYVNLARNWNQNVITD